MPIRASDVLTAARIFLNDNGPTVQLWTDAILLPILQRAYDELQTILRQRAAPIMKVSVTEPINLGQLSFPSPPDIVSPIQLFESIATPINNLMTEADPLPQIPQSATLNWWQWSGTQVNFVGATTTRIVLMYYWRNLAPLATPNDFILVINGEMWLAPRTAAIAAGSVGEEITSTAAANDANEFLERVVLANRGRAPQLAGASVRP